MTVISKVELMDLKRIELGVFAADVAREIVDKVHKMQFLSDPVFKKKLHKLMYGRRAGRIGRHVSECKDCQAAFRQVKRSLTFHMRT